MAKSQFDFEWDPDKAAKYRRRHGISFEDASTIFLDPLAMSFLDEKHRDQEERWVTQGLTRSRELLIVIHAFRRMPAARVAIRIISARLATRRERKTYEEEP